MGSTKWYNRTFGKRVKAEREDRGWTQAELATMLESKGVSPMHSTTVAKIEAGDRSVRINEAVGIAELFEVSLESLLGCKPGAQRSELSYTLRLLRDTALESSHQLYATIQTIREQLEELPSGFDNADMLQRVGYATWSHYLWEADESLMGLVNLSQELLRREQGRPELTEEALMELDVPPPELRRISMEELPHTSIEELKATLKRSHPGAFRHEAQS